MARFGANRGDVSSEAIERSEPAFATANGLELCYETFGNRADPALLLIMGLGAQMILWHEDFCAALARQGRFVVRFDNRDIGKSARCPEDATPTMAEIFAGTVGGAPVAAPYTLRDMAADAVGLLDALGLDRADVVGASMGGAIAMEMATAFPERMRTMTLIFAPSGDPASPPPTPQALANLIKPPALDHDAYVKAFVETWRVLAADHFPFDEARTTWEGETSFARGPNPAGVSRQMRAIIASGNRLPRLAAVRVPALVIHGSLDPLVRLEVGLAVAGALPGATLSVVEGMGHSLPRGAWPQILEAIDRHSPAR
jgi:pimeloyl-ACP methyl ester carboxylesterase